MQAPVYQKQVRDTGPEPIRRAPADSKVLAAMGRAVEMKEEGDQKLAHGVAVLGAGIQQAADDADQAAVNSAVSEYMEKSTDLLYSPDKGLMNITGAGAQGLFNKSKESHEKLYEDVAQKLKPHQRTKFTGSIVNYNRGITQSVMAHEGKAMGEYRKTEALKVLDTAAIAMAKNPDAMSMEAQEDLFRAGGVGIYGPNVTEAQIDDLRSKFFSAAAMRMAEDDPIKAETFLQGYEKNMNPVDADDTKLKLEKIAEPVHVQAEADAQFKKHGIDGLAAAQEDIRAKYFGTKEDSMLQATEAFYADKKRERDDLRQSVFGGLYEAIMSKKQGKGQILSLLNKNKEILTPENYWNLKGLLDHQFTPPRVAKRPLTKQEMVNEQNAYNAAKEYAISPERPTPQQINDKFGKYLSDTAFESIIRLTAPKAGGTDDKNSLFSANSVVKTMADDAGITKNVKEFESFDGQWLTECASRAKKKGASLTQGEMVEAGRVLIEDKVIGKRSSWFGDAPTAKEYQIRQLGFTWNKTINAYTKFDNGKTVVLEDSDIKKLTEKPTSKRKFLDEEE